ncbi:MAG TPA: hypothetical protein VFQ77_20700 [Pseudonocardiaceae bacterium]|jgi:hypothetical protein|nr:hypothetical protein [Pseudonocardiaceae bacterium]
MAKQQDDRPVPPEGRSRGPIIHSGGEQDIGAPTPPYESRQTEGKDEEQLIQERGDTSHFAGPREVSEEEREGMHPADTTPAGPMGVGETRGGQGNLETYGESEESRRAGRLETSHTGVGKSGPTDAESPNLQPGDQGG